MIYKINTHTTRFPKFLYDLKHTIFVRLDKVSLDFYIYQLFNNHTERLLDTVVPLNYFMSKTLVILWGGELVSFLHPHYHLHSHAQYEYHTYSPNL